MRSSRCWLQHADQVQDCVRGLTQPALASILCDGLKLPGQSHRLSRVEVRVVVLVNAGQVWIPVRILSGDGTKLAYVDRTIELRDHLAAELPYTHTIAHHSMIPHLRNARMMRGVATMPGAA